MSSRASKANAQQHFYFDGINDDEDGKRTDVRGGKKDRDRLDLQKFTIKNL